MRQSQLQRGFSLVELVTVLAVLTVCASIAVPAMYQARDASRWNQCKNNLKQFGISLHNYHDAHKTFPPGWTNHTERPGAGPRFGWASSLLPFMEYAELYTSLDFNSHRISSVKQFDVWLPVHRCPSDTSPDTNPLRGGFGTSNYSGSFGPVAPPRWLPSGMSANWPGEPDTPLRTSGIFWLNSRCGFRDITDGSSNTFLVGERAITGGASIWMGVRGNHFENDQVTDTAPGHEINSGYAAFSSRHTGGAHFLFADGAVRYISEKIKSGTDQKPTVFQHLGHRADNQVLGEF